MRYGGSKTHTVGIPNGGTSSGREEHGYRDRGFLSLVYTEKKYWKHIDNYLLNPTPTGARIALIHFERNRNAHFTKKKKTGYSNR